MGQVDVKRLVFERRQKSINQRGEFAKKDSWRYTNVSLKHKWINDYIWLKDERLDLITDRIDCVYAYEFPDFNAVYIG